MADNSQQALADIQAFDSSRANPTDVLSQAEGKYGINQSRQRLVGLRSAIMGTEGLLNAVDPSVTGRTSNSLVTEAQRSRMVANERAPIAEQYSQQQGALSNENASLSDAQSQAAKEAQLRLSGDDTKRSSLQSLYDSLYKREQDAAAIAEARRQDDANRADNARYAALMQQLTQANNQKIPSGVADTRPGLNNFYNEPDNPNIAKGRGVAKYQLNGVWYDSAGDPVSGATAAGQQAQAKNNNKNNLIKGALLTNPLTLAPTATYLAGKSLVPKAVSGVKSLFGKFF
jgi:hypothetical protein